MTKAACVKGVAYYYTVAIKRWFWLTVSLRLPCTQPASTVCAGLIRIPQPRESQRGAVRHSAERASEAVLNHQCSHSRPPFYRDSIVPEISRLQSFDGYFILSYLIRTGIVPKVIFNGSKIMQLDVPEYKIKFR